MDMSHFNAWREGLYQGHQLPEDSQENVENVEPNTAPTREAAVRLTPSQKKRKKKQAIDLGEEEEEEDTSRWLDSHVLQLIKLRSELDMEFAAAAGKQGENTWFKLHRMMLIACPGFRKSHSACKKKWDAEYKKYKEDKRFLQISGNDRHIQSRFFEQIDMDWANRANVKKVVHSDASGTPNPIPLDEGLAAEPTGDGDEDKLTKAAHRHERKEVKRSTAEKLCNYLGEMVEVTKSMARTVEESGKVFDRLDAHMEKLIEKL
jgi:hypothetical protein